MEFTVYDGPVRRLGLILMLPLLLGMFAAFGIYSLLPHGGTSTNMPVEFYFSLIFPVGIVLAVFAVAEITTGVRIRIERATGSLPNLCLAALGGPAGAVPLVRFRPHQPEPGLSRGISGFPAGTRTGPDGLLYDEPRERTRPRGQSRRRMRIQGQRPAISFKRGI